MTGHMFFLLPVLAFAGAIGVGLGVALARFTHGRAHWQRYALPYIGLALLLFFTIPIAITILDLVTRSPFKGECSGWMERGSHPCTIWEYYFGEIDFLFFLTAAPAAPVFLVACVTYAVISRRRATKVVKG